MKTIILSLFLGIYAQATIKVAVLDTGFDDEYHKNNIRLCNEGHKSFVDEAKKLYKEEDVVIKSRYPTCEAIPDNFPAKDTHGHGTHISGLIDKYAENADYCQIIIKWYDPRTIQGDVDTLTKAIEYAISLNVNIINISAGGLTPNDKEKAAIKKALNKGIVIVVAAGNEKSNLDQDCNYFPACYYPELIVVGNKNNDNTISESSNKGEVEEAKDNEVHLKPKKGSVIDVYEYGTNVKSLGLGKPTDIMTGTSQATSIVTGKLVKYLDLYEKRKIKKMRKK